MHWGNGGKSISARHNCNMPHVQHAYIMSGNATRVQACNFLSDLPDRCFVCFFLISTLLQMQE